MLCHSQHCSYYHWVLHTDIQLNSSRNKYSKSRNYKLLNKKRAAITKLLDEFKQKPRYHSKYGKNTRQINCEETPVICVDSIPIPKDPTSPYAFTVNVGNIPKPNKREISKYNQVGNFILLLLDPRLTFNLTSLNHSK